MSEKGLIETVETPEFVHFDCPDCKRRCVLYPRNKPMGAQHVVPTCKSWQQVEAGKEDLERFLIKAGVDVLVLQGKA